MKLWTALNSSAANSEKENKRWAELSRVLNDRGAKNEFVPYDGPAADALTDLKALERFDHVRTSVDHGATLLKHMKIHSSWITLLRVTDGMMKKSGAWWPLCALYEGFGEVLLERGQDLDMRGSVLIAGIDGTARIAAAAFFKSGFRQFILTGSDEREAARVAEEIRANFFGLTLQTLAMERIVLLPGESSVVVNCTPAESDNNLLVELSYLNFLKRPGLLFDMNLSSQNNVLVQEANDAAVAVISGLEMAARSDLIWAKWAFETEIPLDEYRATLSGVYA